MLDLERILNFKCKLESNEPPGAVYIGLSDPNTTLEEDLASPVAKEVFRITVSVKKATPETVVPEEISVLEARELSENLFYQGMSIKAGLVGGDSDAKKAFEARKLQEAQMLDKLREIAKALQKSEGTTQDPTLN